MIEETRQWVKELRHWFGHNWLYWETGQFDVPYGLKCRTCQYCNLTHVHRNGHWHVLKGMGRV